MSEKLDIQSLHDGQMVRLMLNAPTGNILDREMITDLQTALEKLRLEPRIKLIQITGAGDHFSFGASIQEHTKNQVADMLAQFHQLFYTLADLSIPTAALVSGHCLGGGMELALMCNFLFADKSARFGQPEINLGIFAPAASLLLPLKIGRTRAEDILLTGRLLTADEAREFGLLTDLFDDQEALHSQVETWARKHLFPKSAAALRFGVQAVRLQFNRTLRERLTALENLYVNDLVETHDATEGISAFLERRIPKWENC